MRNDNKAIDRLFKLQAKINMMVVDGNRDAETVADALQEILEEKREYVRLLKTITLASTRGGITLAKADGVFYCIDSDFKDWGTDVSSEDTAETKVYVFEMAQEEGNFQALFRLLGDPRKLCLTQGQIVEFCCSYQDWLQREDEEISFLFQVDNELFIAYVHVVGGHLEVDVRRVDDETMNYHNRHRLVVAA